MPSLRLNQSGPLAAFFNRFLVERGFPADGGDVFNAVSHEGTKQLQRWIRDQTKSEAVQVDGLPGNQTFGYACAISDSDDFDPAGIAAALGIAYPERLLGLPPPPTVETQKTMFGAIAFDRALTVSNPERIAITNTFATNIVAVTIPQLVGKVGAPASGQVKAHKLIVRRERELVQACAHRTRLRLRVGRPLQAPA